MDAAKVVDGGRRPGLRVLVALAALAAFVAVVVAVPGPARAQAPATASDVPVPTTLPPVKVLREAPQVEGGSGGGPTSTTTPTTTTTVAPPTERGRDTAGGGGATAPAGDAPASSSRRASSRSSRVAPDAPVETNLVERAVVDTAEPPAISRLRRVTVPAARQFGFPLGLALLVLAFLAVQSRLDARDPKLAAAPVTIDDDLLPFR